METDRKGKIKKVILSVVPLLMAGLFGYGVYSFYYEYKRHTNIPNIALNIVLILISLSVILVLYFKKRGTSPKMIAMLTVCADVFTSFFLVGLPYFINFIFEKDEWDFSVSLSLEILVFLVLILFLSYYISSEKKVIGLIKVVLSCVVAEISFKSVTALVMVILTLFGSLTLKSDENLKFAEQKNMVKTERQYDEYIPSENDIYVNAKSRNGNGSKESPFTYIEEAENMVRQLRSIGIKEHINIWVYGGEYFIENTLEFNEDNDNISFKAYPGEKPSFTGARKITGFKESTQNGVKVFVADVPTGLKCDSVVKNGKTLPKTRYPESGYLQIETEKHMNAIWTEEDKKWEYNLGDTEFAGSIQYNPKEIKNIENVAVRVLHYWVTDFAFLSSYDAGTNIYTLSNPTTMTIKAGDRYYFENIFEELNSPGEWYLDSSENKLYYVPFKGEKTEDTVICACVNDKLVDISGAENIDFSGIEFKNTNFTYPKTFDDLNFFCEEKIKAPQAEIDVGGAVEVKKSTDINFISCDFKNIGNTALKFNKLVKNCNVTGCLFENIGGTGVFINGYNTENEFEITENINVIDNKITSYGRNWMSAIGVLLTNARNCVIKNNEISDGYYTAISVGWVWGYKYNVSCNNKIQNNLIYNIGQGWLSDMGGIYTLGQQKGTDISGNVIHDVAADSGQGGYGGWGIYLDEGSSYMSVKNNLVYDCGSESFHQHYGKENEITNNIFALSKIAQIRVSRKEEHNQLHLKGNIILTDNNPAYSLAEEGKFTDESNIYWDINNGKNVYCSETETDRIISRLYKKDLNKMGYFSNAVCENPQFKDPKNGDFTIADGNTAIEKIGFIPWSYSEAGTLSDFDTGYNNKK